MEQIDDTRKPNKEVDTASSSEESIESYSEASATVNNTTTVTPLQKIRSKLHYVLGSFNANLRTNLDSGEKPF
jgi:hypothetical protein